MENRRKQKIERKDYNGVKIGLFNTPCAGFGDIIVCKTFYDYLKSWYPGHQLQYVLQHLLSIVILESKENIYKLYNKENDEDSECIEYHDLKLKKKINFDLMIVIPLSIKRLI